MKKISNTVTKRLTQAALKKRHGIIIPTPFAPCHCRNDEFTFASYKNSAQFYKSSTSPIMPYSSNDSSKHPIRIYSCPFISLEISPGIPQGFLPEIPPEIFLGICPKSFSGIFSKDSSWDQPTGCSRYSSRDFFEVSSRFQAGIHPEIYAGVFFNFSSNFFRRSYFSRHSFKNPC